MQELRMNTPEHYDLSDLEPSGSDVLPMESRIGGYLAFVLALIVVAMLPLTPPTAAIGSAGWLVVGAMLIPTLGVAAAMLADLGIWTFGRILAVSYFQLAILTVLIWLAGGWDTPYPRVMMVMILYVALIQTRRRISVFLVAVAIVLALPVLYDGWNPNAAANIIGTISVWIVLAIGTYKLTEIQRQQRIELHRTSRAAKLEARVDNLTGIGNRRAFEEALDDEIARSRRLSTPLSIVIADIADFKLINDTWGHLEGDRALVCVASAISGEQRGPDRSFRWGGDEFTVILPGADGDGANVVAARLRLAVRTSCLRPDAKPIEIRTGTAALCEGISAEELLSRADAGMLALHR